MRYDLYINDQLCDLDDSSLIVLNYTMEQLTNPTAVKNTYSHEIELPSTERNDMIFSYFYRNDYVVGKVNFSPLQQVPFAIYNELGEIAERGYIKLDEVQVDKIVHTYKVVLYGGLGSFFYAMGYTDNGDALKLSDLQYMQNANDENRLNFPASAYIVDLAWRQIESGEQYKVLNFAPVYNGKPSGDFDAQTAIYMAERLSYTGDNANKLRKPIYGLGDITPDKMEATSLYNITIDGVKYPMVYATKVKLNRAYTEWETKDLRAYLQRPILSVRKFVEAVQRRATSYGYTLNLDSAFFNENNPYYNDAWLTLPSLQSLTKESKNGQIQISGSVIVPSSSPDGITQVAYTLPDTEGYEYGAEFKNISINIPELSIAISKEDAKSVSKNVFLDGIAGRFCYIAWFIQAYITNANGVIVGVSDVAVVNSGTSWSAEKIAESAGFAPITVTGGDTTKYTSVGGVFRLTITEDAAGNKICKNTANIQLNIPTAPDAQNIMIRVQKLRYNNTPTDITLDTVFSDTTNAERPDYFPFVSVQNAVYGSGEVTAYETIRSGAIINKSDLLNIGKTPLEVLLSYCKLFGLVWNYEANSQTINLLQRSTFYNGGTAEDWSNRIDRNREITIKPFEFDKRFYDFELETPGQWAEAYKEKYGKVYGNQRVNTGYNFDQDNKNLLQGNALKGGAEVLEQSKYFNNITEDGKVCPSVFLEGGEYSVINGEEEETAQVQTPTNNATIEYMNELQGYDYIPKLQMHKADNAPIDSGLTLLLYKGKFYTQNTPYERFRISDDIPEMDLLYDGKLCWILEGSYPSELNPTYFYLPHFVRASGVSLDMGIPQELDNPDADTEAVQKSIYSQYWQKYLSDRYDQNSRVLTCYVDLRGVQVSNALFRNFYYFDNAVWVLNRIINYSMTTIGTTQCEFVKVQDINNYKG